MPTPAEYIQSGDDIWSWYCTSCGAELGVDLDDRGGEPGPCSVCGDPEIAMEYWNPETPE